MANLNSYIDIKLPAAPSASDPNLHGELLILYNSLRNLMSDLSESYGVSIGSTDAIAIANNTTSPVLTLNLPMGAWDVYGGAVYIPDGTTRIYIIQYGIAAPGESFPDMHRDIRTYNPPMTVGVSQPTGGGTVRRVIYLSAPAEVRLLGYASYDTAGMKVYGYLNARRVAG